MGQLQVGSQTYDVTLLSLVTTTGAGVSQPVPGVKTLRIEVWGTGTFDVQIQGIMSNGSGNAITIDASKLKAVANVTDIVAAGFYDVNVSGFNSVQANVITITGGNVSVAGKFVA